MDDVFMIFLPQIYVGDKRACLMAISLAILTNWLFIHYVTDWGWCRSCESC